MKQPTKLSPTPSKAEIAAAEETSPVTATPPDAPTPAPNPEASIPAAMAVLAQLHREAGRLSRALSKHLRATARQPELHGRLHRVQVAIGDFRGAVADIVVESSA